MRRVALIAAALCLVPAGVSYVGAMAQRSDSGFGVRTVEWMRDNGARGLITTVENIYYSLNAPAKGGPALRSLPAQSGILATKSGIRTGQSGIRTGQSGTRTGQSGILAARSPSPPDYRPPPIAPVIHPALPGEGAWHATFAAGGPRPPVLITSFRPDPDYPRLVAGIAWIDHTRASVMLYPGLAEPSVSMASRGPMEVPVAMRGGLVATFNSAFKLSDSGGGFAYAGHTYAPMHDGTATIVRYRSGRVDIIDWTAGATAGPDVVYARQNLPLIVDNGRPNPNLADGPQWGATLGNAIRVWRSAVGIDRRGNLIYAAADYQTVGSLAQILVHAGAVRAMELDINSYWPSFITYRFPGARQPANLLAGMVRSPSRYLTPDDRDFFAVYAR